MITSHQHNGSKKFLTTKLELHGQMHKQSHMLKIETVVQYFSKALKIMTELKTKINPMELDIPDFTLPLNQVDEFVALPQGTKTALNTHMRNHVTSQV